MRIIVIINLYNRVKKHVVIKNKYYMNILNWGYFKLINSKIIRFIVKSPLFSITVFTLFVVTFLFISNDFKIDKYEAIEAVVKDYNAKNKIMIIEIQDNTYRNINEKSIIYVSVKEQEQLMPILVKGIRNNIIEVIVDDERLNEATNYNNFHFEMITGTEPIGEILGL